MYFSFATAPLQFTRGEKQKTYGHHEMGEREEGHLGKPELVSFKIYIHTPNKTLKML
jgi:hypothetical protein